MRPRRISAAFWPRCLSGLKIAGFTFCFAPHKMSRPELVGPAELYYNDSRAAQYTTNSRVMTVQSDMAERALQLLNFKDEGPKLIMDLGCGSGLSGQVLTDAGHLWVGLDIRCVAVDGVPCCGWRDCGQFPGTSHSVRELR